ncbi:MAG: hypothetical protein FWB71_05030 [Defluviitaleaceae bacterium]|nr:hypothetical protein [Defluviitaleaceae bacterium]
MAKIEIVGMKELERSFRRIGDVPQKYVTGAAKKAMNTTLKLARKEAPEQSGDLRRGIIKIGERSRRKGRKVFRLVFDKKKDEIFQTKNAAGEIVGYYPVSQEYGFFARDGTYIPGFKFGLDAIQATSGQIEKIVVADLGRRIDKQIKAGGLK